MIHSYNIYYFIDKFDSDEISNLNKKINLIYRNYQNLNFEDDIKKIKDSPLSNDRKIYISNNIKIAIKYNLDGLYIPSFNSCLNYQNKSLRKNFDLIGSAHNLREIKIKEKQGCRLIFIAPVFKTEKKTNYLGFIKFNHLYRKSSAQIIALGGINEKNIKRFNCTNIQGFAGINWIKKTGLL